MDSSSEELMNGLDIQCSDEDAAIEIAKLLQDLTIIWVNEMNAPELLQYASYAVSFMMAQIEGLEENLRNFENDHFRTVPHQMELNRIRYILASYHRCRLEKIELHTSWLLNRDRDVAREDAKYMSPKEREFAEEYLRNMNSYLRENCLKTLPGSQDLTDIAVTPDSDSVVFLRIFQKQRETELLASEQTLDLPEKSQHLVPYRYVHKLIETGSAVLI